MSDLAITMEKTMAALPPEIAALVRYFLYVDDITVQLPPDHVPTFLDVFERVRLDVALYGGTG